MMMIMTSMKTMLNDDDYNKYENYVVLEVGINAAEIKIKVGGEKLSLIKITSDQGLDVGVTQTYWFSYDRDGKVFKYGKEHIMEETTLMCYDFNESYDSKLKIFFDINPGAESTILLYSSRIDSEMKEDNIDKTNIGSINFEPLIHVTSDPLIFSPSPFLREFEPSVECLINPEHTHSNSPHLPPECKQIYENIKNILVLDPLLVDQIRNSIQTEGYILNKFLKKKAYLRITFGDNQGNSPGCPYVLEIWPAGAESPNHNH